MRCLDSISKSMEMNLNKFQEIVRRRQWQPHSSTLAWKIPWMEEPGRLQSMGLLRVGHDWATSLSLLTFIHWRRKWQPTHVLAWRTPGTGEPGGLPSMESQSQIRLKWLSSNSQEIVKGREAWYAEVHGVAKSGTQLSDWTTTAIIPWIFLEHFCLNWNVHQHAFLTWIGYPLSVLLLQYLLQLCPPSFIVLYAAFLTINVIMAIIDTHLVLSFFF